VEELEGHDPERDRRDHEGRQPGGHLLLRHSEDADIAEDHAAHERGRHQRAARRVQPPERGEDGAHHGSGHEEAHAGPKQRWHRLDHHADRRIGPAPRQVHGA
jgi:hypothetical protein